MQGFARKMKVFLIAFCIAHSVLCFSFASSGASFLKIPVGARAAGMGNAYTALANDVSAMHWNPAGLSLLTRKEISAMHTELFADTRYDFVGYAHPGEKGSFGVGAVYLTQGSLEGRGEDRSRTSDFTASDLAFTLGLARSNLTVPFFDYHLPFSVGANVKFLQSRIEGLSSSGFAFDLGVIHASPVKVYTLPLKLGFSIQNIGPKMSFIDEGYNLPMTLAGGAAIELPVTRLPLTISADIKHEPYDSRTTFSVGGEFSPVSLLSLRAGYLINAVKAAQSGAGKSFTDKLSDLSGLGMGLGFRMGPGTLDYSFTPAGELGNAQRISLSIKFK